MSLVDVEWGLEEPGCEERGSEQEASVSADVFGVGDETWVLLWTLSVQQVR